MKNIHTILSEYGITVPEDKKAEFDKAVAENYKTSAEFEKKVNRLTEDLNAEKQRADDAVETLKGFEGKDFDAITKDRDEWKRKHDEAIANHKKEQEDREFNELLESSIAEAKGKNAKAISALLDLEKIRNSKNQLADLTAAMNTLRTESSYLFDDNGGKPQFADPKATGNPGTLTRKDVMAIKDPAERQAKIAANMHLFQKG
jgi:hypothetical protein